MKKSLLTTALLFCGIAIFAQSTPNTLLGNGVESTSGFGGFMIGFTPAGNNQVAMTGGGGALLINNAFYFGGYGFDMAEDLVVTNNNTRYDVGFEHGGLMMGFILLPERVVHLGISSKLGWGDLSFHEYDVNGTAFVNQPFEDNVFVLLPQIELEVNMTSWFKVNASVGYQLVNGVNNFYYDKNDFDGASMGISFLFGWFQ